MIYFSRLLLLTSICLLTACAMGNTSIANEDNSTLQQTVVVGKTTQSEVFQLFGEPSIKTQSSDGTEIWFYSMANLKLRTLIPFADIIAGGSSTESKELTIRFRDRVVVSRELSNRKDVLRDTTPTPPAADATSAKSPATTNTNTKQVNTTEITGTYSNRSESSFIFTLQLNKDNSAVYEEIDPEGGKPLKFRGRWKKTANQLELNFGKNGVYRYSIEANLSWSDFGCKGGSFGFKNISVPKSQGTGSSIVHNVWRKSDLRTADKCQAL